MKIVVTGGSGFIGTNLIASLSVEHTVLNVDIVPPVKVAPNSEWKNCDIRRTSDLKCVFREFLPDYVVHLAARTDLGGATPLDYDVNTAGTESLIKAMEGIESIRRILFASSMLVCEVGYIPLDCDDYCPSTPYGESKVAMEHIIKQSSLSVDWAIVRPTSIWGPWFKSPYRTFFEMVRSGKYIGISKCANKTYGYVGNSVLQIERLLFDVSGKSKGRCFYLGDSPPININIWASEIAERMGKKPPVVAPYGLMYVLSRAGDLIEKTGFKSPLTSFRFRNMTTDNILPLGELYDLVGQPPISRSRGIDLTLEWLDNH